VYIVADETAAFGAAIIAIGVAASRAAIGVAAMAAPYGVWDEADEARTELRM
jgi:NADH:ubiquinone oxidoreductase subunit K